MRKICYCCGEELKEENSFWHKKCIKKFFGCNSIPCLDFSALNDELENQAIALLKSKKNITGVQSKLSLGLSKEKDRLSVVDYPLGYIIKPETENFNDIARAEFLNMQMAKACHIETVPNGLIKSKDGSYFYITKRIDRNDGNKIHMEDFCQLSELQTERKYSGSYERLGKSIRAYSDHGTKDLSDYFYLLLFNYVSCNSDMHLKNFSLIEAEENYLSPAYDLLPVNIIYPKDKDEVALSLNGKKRNLVKNDFIELGISIGLNEKVIMNLINEIKKYEDVFVGLINDSLITDEHKEAYVKELKRRINKL